MNRPIVIASIYASFYVPIFMALTVVADGSVFEGWMWPACGAGFILMIVVIILMLNPRFLPNSLSARIVDDIKGFETYSWFGSLMPLLAFGGFLVPFGASVLSESSAVLPSRNSGSMFSLFIFGFVPIAYVLFQSFQVIGDGSSGIRIYEDKIILRRIGHYGWCFNFDDIDLVDLRFDKTPFISIEGKGRRIDRFLGGMLPEAKVAVIQGAILAGLDGNEIYRALESRGYKDKVILNERDSHGRPI